MIKSWLTPSQRFLWLLPVVSGLLLMASMPPADWHFLAWIALTPLGFCWTLPNLSPAFYRSALIGGVLSNLAATAWVRTSYLETDPWFGPLSGGWLVIGLVYGLFFLATFEYGRRLAAAVRLSMTLTLPVVWVSYELVRHHFVLLLDQPGYPWGKLALTLPGNSPLLQAADLGGEYLLSFVIAMANGALVDLVTALTNRKAPRPAQHKFAPVVALGTLTLFFAYGHWRLNQNDFKQGPVVCLMGEVDLPPHLDRERIAAAVNSFNELLTEHTVHWPDVLLWPEQAFHHRLIGSSPEDWIIHHASVPPDVKAIAGVALLSYPRDVETALLHAAQEVDAVLAIGCERLVPAWRHWDRYNALALVDPHRQTINAYDKRFRVPWTEYQPNLVATFSEDDASHFTAGAKLPCFEVQTESRRQPYRCGIALCYELCFARHFQFANPAGDQVEFYLNSGSEGQDRSQVLASLMLRQARLRAIENRRPIVRNIIQGTSGIIDANGRLTVEVDQEIVVEPVVVGPLPLDRRRSLYASTGDCGWIMLCTIFPVGAAIYSRRNRRSHSK